MWREGADQILTDAVLPAWTADDALREYECPWVRFARPQLTWFRWRSQLANLSKKADSLGDERDDLFALLQSVKA